MLVDKFGRNGDTVYTAINIANLTNSFLRRDGGNTAIGAVDMNSNIIKNVADPLSNQDVATKNYEDKYAITTVDGVVSGDIKLNVGSDLVRSLGKESVMILLQVRIYTSAGDRLKYAVVFRTRFTISSAYQDTNRWRFSHLD